MNIEEIMQYLPHRPPFLMIDRIIEFVPDVSLVAIKNVTINEAFFGGHFPERPVMPGVLILEAMAQASVVMANKSMSQLGDQELYLFAGIDHARFKRVVIPGDQLRIEVKFTRNRRKLMKVEGIATVAGDLACTAELMTVRSD